MRSFPAFTLNPLITSHFISSVRVLKLLRTEQDARVGTQLAKVLPSFQVLEELHMIGRCSDPHHPSPPIRCKGTWKDLFTTKWPPSLRRLTLDRMAGQRLKNLANLLNRDGLPNLEELSLPFMNIQGNDDAPDQLGIAFRSSGGTRISTLYLHVDDSDKARCWDFIIRVLCLNIEEPDARIFPHLKLGDRDLPSLTTLILGNINWFSFGRALLDGRFPRLARLSATSEFRNHDLLGADVCYHKPTLPPFYEVDVKTSKLWFSGVLKQRSSLKLFPEKSDINFMGSKQVAEVDAARQNLGKELVLGLSRRSSHVASCIQTLHLSQVRINEEACKALIGIINLHGLASVKSLQFLLDGSTCQEDLFGSLGGVMNHHHLPALRILDIGARREDSIGLSLHRCWQAFFGCMKEGGLSRLETFAAAHSVQEICAGLAAQEGPLMIFGSVIKFRAYGDLETRDIGAISAVIHAGAFPSMKSLGLKPGTINF